MTGPRDTDGTDGAASETYAFTCGDCGTTWKKTFQVRLIRDADGVEALAYADEDGTPVRSPLATGVCPYCGSHAVHAMSPELAARAKAAEHTPPTRHGLHLPRLHHRADETEPGGS
ncbi:hypothetical protein ACQB60_43645 [Actinomycetota bacterium Odt1-20B]